MICASRQSPTRLARGYSPWHGFASRAGDLPAGSALPEPPHFRRPRTGSENPCHANAPEFSRAACPRGIIMADVIMAIGVLGLAAVVFSVALNRQQRADLQLADSRQAVRLAETALLDLQSEQALPRASSDETLEILPCPGGASVAGQRWIQVIATVRGRQRSLIGLVPESATSQPVTRKEGQ